MSSRHWRGQKILALCNANIEEEIENKNEDPEPSDTLIPEWSVVENVEFEYIGLENINLNSILTLNSPLPNFFTTDAQHTFLDNCQIGVTTSDEQSTLLTDTTSSEQPTLHTDTTSNVQPTLHTFTTNHDEQPTSHTDTTINEQPTVTTNTTRFDEIEDFFTDDSVQEGLVPYKIHSSSESDCEIYPEKSKKRKKRVQIQKSNWFAEKNRKLRESGKKYYGRKKEEEWNYEVPRKPRVMENRCKCKETQKGSLKCSTFAEEDRKHIFKEFWCMSWPEKKVYVNSLVRSTPVQRPRGRMSDRESKRTQSLFYYLKREDQPIKVCRAMFLNTLGIGRWTVLSWKNKEVSNNNNNKERNRLSSSKPFEIERRALKKFFESLPAMESHYCRASTKKNYLLPEWRSKRSLYQFYVDDWCKMHNVKPLSICKFHEQFDEQNLALYFPKKDQCELCALYKVGKKSQEEYLEHLSKKEEARAEKGKDKAEGGAVFTVDLQAVLMAPKSKISSLYYRTKLQVHNLAFFNLTNKDGYCYLWNETEGGLNSEEFASVWVSLIENKVLLQNEQDKPKKICFYSDGCTYQNRNCVLSNALLSTAINHKIIIEQKFLEVGHTQMEADSIHSSVERALKDKNIHVPAEYISICKSARKTPRPYDVTYLNHTFFKSFDEVNFLKSIRPGRGKGDAKVTDIRALQYNPNGDIFYKLRFTEPWKILPQRKSPAVIALPFDSLRSHYLTRRNITKRKFEDLQYLKNTLPEDYRSYYDNLPHD